MDDATPSAMMDAAIKAVRNHALNSGKIDWEREEALLHADVANAADDKETYASISRLLMKLQDHHSFASPPRPPSAGKSQEMLFPSRIPEMDGRFGGINVPYLNDPRGERIDYVLAGRQIISDMPQARGWIVDLRENSGGNMWPMLAAVRALLGTGPLGYFEYREGKLSRPWQAILDRSDTLGPPHQLLADIPVAVLIGPNTASSGEAVAITFQKRNRTRFFGEATRGLTTGNQGFSLPDGGTLWLTTSQDLDCEKQRVEGKIDPDEFIAGSDSQLEAARAWLSASS